MLRYRGKGATKRKRQWRQDDGSLAIRVENESDENSPPMLINLVDRYKHLGGIIMIDGSVAVECKGRNRSAMAAYSPIASKVFGAKDIGKDLKLDLMRSLVLSRSLFNTHCLVMSPAGLKALDQVYMRCVRKIHDQSLFSDKSLPHIVVRNQTRTPSVDCLVSRQRLCFLKRLLLSDWTGVLALLCSQRPTASRVDPWITQIMGDLRLMHARVSVCARLPSPSVSLDKGWLHLIRSDIWNSLVKCLHFCDSSLDRVVRFREVSLVKFPCQICGDEFPDLKSQLAHVRTRHPSHPSARAHQRFFTSVDATCLACGTCFVQRYRLFRHLCDKRRTKCWTKILECGAEPLSVQQVAEFDAELRAARCNARAQGHIHPVACGPARTKAGKHIGHAV